jgi:cell division protease FtsH
LGILLANYLLMRFFLPSPDAPVTVPYTLFKAEVANGNVEAIHSQGETITGRFKAPVTYPRRQRQTPERRTEARRRPRRCPKR